MALRGRRRHEPTASIVCALGEHFRLDRRERHAVDLGDIQAAVYAALFDLCDHVPLGVVVVSQLPQDLLLERRAVHSFFTW